MVFSGFCDTGKLGTVLKESGFFSGLSMDYSLKSHIHSAYMDLNTNLLTNSRQEYRNGLRSHVRSDSKNRHLQVWLSKTGCEKLEQFLDKFSTGDNLARSRYHKFRKGFPCPEARAPREGILCRHLRSHYPPSHWEKSATNSLEQESEE